MGCWGKPTDHDTNHSDRLTAIPLTRYPPTSIESRGADKDRVIVRIEATKGTWQTTKIGH